MAHLVTQVLLPISLAVMMLGIGLSVSWQDFAKLVSVKVAIVTGFFLQVVALPLLAFILISVFGIRGEYAIAIMIVACCPGGVTSNAITFVFSGVVALSVLLTLLSSLVSPLTIPAITQWSLAHYADQGVERVFSLGETLVKLFVLSVVPIVIGVIIQRLSPVWCVRHRDQWRRYSGWWFLILIVLMIVSHYGLLSRVIVELGGFFLCLATATILLGYLGARLMGFDESLRLTLAIEVGIQNAGVGMIVTSTILHNDAMTMVLIAYGILMQIPIFLFAWLYRRYTHGCNHVEALQ